MIKDKYKIEVNIPGTGNKEISPVNSKLEWSWARENDQVYFRKKLTTPLSLQDDNSNANTFNDFSILYPLERSRATRCEKVDISIYKKCRGGQEKQFYNGYLSLIDGTWNKDHCHVEILPRIKDQYACLYSGWEKEINLLNLNLQTHDARSTIGAIEYKQCERTTNAFKGAAADIGIGSCFGGTDNTVPQGWVLVYWQITIGSKVVTNWAREVFLGPNPGAGWIQLDSQKWVRPPEVVENLNARVDDGQIFSQTWSIVSYNLTNGIKLNEALQEMIKKLQCGYSIISNFFNINPDGTAPANTAYSKAKDHAENLFIYNKTDVKKAKKKDDSATALNISIKRLLQNIQTLFNTRFVIEETTNTFRLEHLSYFQNRRMLDLTQDRFKSDIAGRWEYSYAKEALPIKEHFRFMEPTTPLFEAQPIEYGESCSNDEQTTNEINFTADFTGSSVDDIVEFPDKYSDQGMVIIERSEFGFIVSGLISGGSKAARNGNLSMPTLLDFYHRHGRPQSDGLLNGFPTRFESYKKTRKQVPIQIQICCEDIDLFNPMDMVKTQLGWGEIVSAKYSEPGEVLTLEIIHD